MNIFYLISKMSCNKSGSRRVPIQHYLMKNIGIQRKINEYLLFDQQNVLQQIWQPESTNTALFDEKKLESKEKSTHIVFLISKMSCNKSGSRRVPIQHYLMKNIGIEKNSMNIFYLISKMSCNKSGSQRLPIQHYLMKKLESKEKSMNIFCLISKMSCNKSGSRSVPIQQYFGNFWNRKKNQRISCI